MTGNESDYECHGVLVGLRISPFAKRGLDEALGLAVGLGRIRPSEDLAQAKAFASCSDAL
jgi:hypothetical protein